jgi:uncharacterized protein YciI
MKFYLFKLIPPRPSFAQDMTAEEAQLMRQHSAYWSGLMRQGLVHAFGPVADPKGIYGIAVAELEDQSDPQVLGRGDPVIQANAGFSIELLTMPSLVTPKTASSR